MAEMTSEGGVGGGAGIDLSQFFQVFFEEAGENLQRMEQLLLELDIEAADDEAMNAIFRCAHSIKGGGDLRLQRCRGPDPRDGDAAGQAAAP